jgi:hypothetical protein
MLIADAAVHVPWKSKDAATVCCIISNAKTRRQVLRLMFEGVPRILCRCGLRVLSAKWADREGLVGGLVSEKESHLGHAHSRSTDKRERLRKEW